MEKKGHGWKLGITIFVFVCLTAWWSYLHLFLPKDDPTYQVFSATYGVIALVGGVFGIAIAQKWGGFKSALGKAIMMFSFGLLAQEFGQIVYSYIFYTGQVPYPSLGDLGYFGTIPFYILGVVYVAKASGVKLGLRSFGSKMSAVVVPIVILWIGYLFFLRGYEFNPSQPLTTFLDFGYPLGEAVYISLALLTYFLTRKVLGGIMKGPVSFVLFALLMQFVSDYTFLYQSHQETAYPGGVPDLMYLVSYFLMALALIKLESTFLKVGELA